MQFGVNMGDSLSSTQLFIFWGFILLSVTLFIFFLVRTDRLINTKNNTHDNLVHSTTMNGDVSDEEAAAIALAIHMYKIEIHDMESLTITLKKVSRIYSPWSSKIYTLRQNPR
jgi:hypothetical protein